ncbi:MAG TPA: protein kinase [Pyrinomonadaceae bacterium]|nr:protein kinase [Pyrinomonadaceae bacterium]
MKPENWEQVERLYHDALERESESRAAFLDEASEGNEELRREVAALLAYDEKAASFIEAPALDVAAKALASDPKAAEQLESLVASVVAHQIGTYRLLSTLGAGGMGEVHLAFDTRLERKVALKLLSVDLTTDDERVRRFRQEALTASALNHPNIITVYEIGEWEDRAFIATEYVEGVTLRTRMRGRRLPLTGAVDIALQIAGALAAAHRHGIVHRDIKPENVMVRPDGLVKVLDFGIAKYAESARTRESKQSWIRTETGVVMGTTAYMSPEQARGQEVDARTDIWSLGVILYEMVTRRLPFAGKTPTDRVAAILEREPEPISKLRRGIPAELERIVNRALAKNRNERYAQAADLAADLRKLRAALGEERPPRFALPVPARILPALSRPRATVALAALSLMIIALTVAGLVYSRRDTGSTAVNSLAILPLVNVSGSAETEYLSDGITESLINDLSQLSSLRVLARSTVFRYKGRDADPLKVGRELGVEAVLTGRVEQRGDTLVVQADLVKVVDGSQLWGGRFNRRQSDVLAVQEEVSREIAGKLRPRLSGEEQRRLTKHHTENAEAYQLYLNGRFYWEKRTPEGLNRAIEYFREAIARDPNYALAYAGLADSYALLGVFHLPPGETFPKAREAALNALRIDDTLAEAHAALGHIKQQYEYDWAGAEREYKRAIELNPNYANAHHFYALYLTMMGRFDEGLAEIRRAQELEPFSLFIHANVGAVLSQARGYDEAISHLKKVLEMNPNFDHARSLLGFAYRQKGMYEEAISEYKKRAVPVSGGSGGELGLAYALSGRRNEALKELDKLQELSKQRYVAPYNRAIIYAGLGDKDNALQWLERAYEDRSTRLVWIRLDPGLDKLRSEPRFAELLRRMNLTA